MKNSKTIKYRVKKLFLFFTCCFLFSNIFVTNIAATEWGKYYEQQIPSSGATAPGLTLSPSGSTSITDVQTQKIVGFPSGSNYTPHYYWEATGGQLIGQADSRSITWKPPVVNASTDFYVLCTLQDGKGHAVTKHLKITVTHDGGTSDGSDLVDPVVSNVHVASSTLTVGIPTTIYWTATDSQTPSSQLIIGIQYKSGSTWFNFNTNAPNTGSIAWTPQEAGNDLKVRVCATDYAGNQCAWVESNPFNVVEQDYIEPPTSTHLADPGVETPNTSIEIRWRKIIDSHYDLNVNYYQLEYAANPGFSGASMISPINDNSDPGNMYSYNSYTVTGLQDNTTYYFHVRGVNDTATGPWSNIVSIRINLEYWPTFNNSYQVPANGSVGVSKTPVLRWEANDNDGDDLDYYVVLGTDPVNLYPIRAFQDPDYFGQNYFDFALEYHEPLRPNTTYYWQVKVREDGRYADYYGGQYISTTPVWSFTTVNTGSDLAIINAVLDSEVKPDSTVRFKVTVKNLGSETANQTAFEASYIKNGSESPFRLCSGIMSGNLGPGQEEIVDVEVQFRSSVLILNGITYDNVLIAGETHVKFFFTWNHEQDVNWNNNEYTVPINYVDAGGPVITYFDLREHGSMYEDWGVEFFARMGKELIIVVDAHDDVQVERLVVQQRYHQADPWETIHDQTNNSPDLFKGVYWPIPSDIQTTDDAQIKVNLYDDNDNMTERVSDPFSIVSNRIEATIEPLAATYKVGETLQYNINYDSDNTIIDVDVWLTYGSNGTSIYSQYNENGITITNPIQWSIPDNNNYVSQNCYLECKLLDDKSNTIEVLSGRFQITPNTSVPAPFNEALVIYNDEFTFPLDAMYFDQDRSVKFVKIDDNNLVHLVLEHYYKYYQDTASNYDEDTYVYENNKYYITYDIDTSTISPKILICGKDYNVVGFDLVGGTPYVLLKNSNYETLYYSQKSGSSFTTPYPIENNNMPQLSGNPLFRSSLNDYSSDLSSRERHVLLNGYLWKLDIFTTRIYRHSFNNGIIGPQEYLTINNSESLASYRIKAVTSGNIIYYIDTGNSKLAKIDTASGDTQSYSLPFNTSSISSDWSKCNVALGEANGKVFLFGNGRVYEFVTNSFVERGPIAYTFDGQASDYSGTNWSNVNFIRTVNADGSLYLLMRGYFWNSAKPVWTEYEILEFNSGTYQFSKNIARFTLNNRIESHGANGISITGNPDLLYIGNNKVLTVFADEISFSSTLHTYHAVLKMLDLATGDCTFIGRLPLKASQYISLYKNNGIIYVLAENKTNSQTECYQISLQNIENSVKQIGNPHFVRHNSSLYATWAFGQPYDGTWNFTENKLNDYVLRRNKSISIWPTLGTILNIADEYIGIETAVGPGYLSADSGKIWSLNTNLTVNQMVYDEGMSTSPCVFESFGSNYIGALNYFSGSDIYVTLLKSDYTTKKLSVIPEFSRITTYDDLMILGGIKNSQAYISKIHLETNQKFDVGLGNSEGADPYNRIDMNLNKYVAVGWDVYLAVADFSGDIVAPDVTITNTETQIVNNTAITLTWNASDNNNQLDKFEIYKEVNGVQSLLTSITDTNTTSYSYTVNETGAAEIKFSVFAYDVEGNIGKDSLVLPIVIYTEDLTSFTLDKSTVSTGGTVTFNWTATGVDATTTYTVSKRPTGTTEWQTYFQVIGQLTKQMVIDDVPGTYDFKIEAGADSIVLTNALTVSGEIPVFDYNQFGVSNSGYYSEPAMVTLNWNIQPFSNQNLVTYDVDVNPNNTGYITIETTTNNFSNYSIPNGVTNINWKITANYQGGQYESNEQTSPLTPLTSPAVSFIELRDNNTDNPKVYLEFTPIQGISEYIVTRQNAGGEYLELAIITGNNYTDSTVSYGETYEYGILSKFGTLKGLKGATQVVPIIINSVDSLVILNENFAVIEDTSLTLNYQPNPLDAYEKYEIFWGTDPGAMQSLAITNARSVDFVDLDYDTTFYVQVNALDANNNITAFSDLFVFFTPPEPVPLPAAPSQLSGEMISLTQIELSWTDNDDNELGFMIERKEGPTGTYQQIYVTDRNYYIDSNNITANTIYFYRVRAYNSSGYSGYCDEINVLSSIIKVKSPNGGETWQIGETVTITWIDNISGNVDIIISRDGGTTWNETLFPDTASDGSESWTVTGPASDQCLIKINEHGGSLTDVSNGPFSIVNPPTIPEIERNALIDLYNSTNGDSWTDNSGWKTPPLHTDGFAMPGTEGTWHGITINNENVIRISLGGNNLTGTIPTSIDDLTALQELYLHQNQLSGVVPAELENLSNLTHLYLHANQLSGSIPSAICNLPALVSLNLSINQLTGNIPTQIANMTNLEELRLYENQLQGNIPDLSGLTKLTYLSLGKNQLEGVIPASLGSLLNLQSLYLYENKLSGGIPTELGDLINLQNLGINGNMLGGSIPGSFINLVNLTSADSGYNALYTDDGALRDFINSIDPDWENTQTVAPTNVSAAPASDTSVEVSWTPITYTGDTGGYRVLYGSASGGPYTLFNTTADKTISSMIVTGLTPATDYYFVVQTRTEPHEKNQNIVDSENSEEVSAATLPPIAAALRVTYPNAGERFPAGSVATITWASNGNIREVTLEYSTDNGQTWMIIIPATANDGSFQWTVPDTPSESCLVRISESDKDQGVSDISDGGFSIVPGPFITVTSPNGGETWEVGSSHSITWTSKELTGNVKIEYSTSGGNSWATITASTANTGSINWTVPNNLSGNCLIRASETDGVPTDMSDSVFSIVSPSSLTVISPNGSESWAAGSNHVITWSSAGEVENVNIEYSADFGGHWITIVSAAANDGSHDWKVADNPSDSCLVRVTESNTDSAASDTSDARFSITPAPVITITSPNGGEKLKAGTTHNITWTSSQVQEEVKIEYSTDNGTNWAPVSLSTGNTGTYNWTVPDNPSKNCLIRISETDGAPADVSDLTFSIESPSTATITVTSPNGGESLTAGALHQVTWTSTGMEANDGVIIEYSTDGGGSWTVIEPPALNSGSYEWHVPDQSSENCLVRISGNDSDEGPSDVSDGVFSIIRDSVITVISPNGGESLTAGTTHEITWTGAGIAEGNYISIQYSIDSGVTWKDIIPHTTNSGTYTWTIPEDSSDDCLIRVSGSDADEGPSDQSDAVFSIVSSDSITVVSPNGGEQWETGSSYDITWTFTGVTGNIVIDLYQGDAFDFNIGTVPVDTGKFAWQIPENFTTGEEYRVFLHKDTIEDYSDAVFSITDQDPNHPDFNNDGKVDILWRNYASGMNEVWYMNGAVKSVIGSLPAMTDLNWRIVGTGDFNRDGKVDILWRHYTTGLNLVWYMDGVVLSGSVNLPVQPDVNWQIVGTGDFNGDGKDDILWRNALEGRNQVWFMDGVIVGKYQGLQSLEGQEWRVVGVGDFNSDGKVDIFWRNYSTGSNEVWYMDGGNRVGTGVLLEMADMSWQVVGIGDFNLDGEVDILWRNNSDGRDMVWYMDGVTRVGFEYIETRSDLNWRIVSNGDPKD